MVAAVMMAMTLPESFSKSIGFIFATTKEGSVLDYKPSIVAAAAAAPRPARHPLQPARHPLQQVSSAHAPLAALNLADFDRVMAANTRSTVAGIKQAARVMVPRRSRCILCTGSTTGTLGGVPALPYSLSKATVVVVVRLVPEELARPGMRMNAISPHTIATPLLVRSLARANPDVGGETLKRMVERGMSKLQGAVLEPEDMARAAVYLASGS
ncbi:hypothetical protein QYE76_019538 [Lolium multiflorum]|uniref:Uncharacterized protein n=1 Tax=Lolium multiflorum TaxID=4521 RepID=A0AAD8R4Q0_LOLMU|nr:hypothetical protein QYE76_019538 [Lolium multiflorum]